MAPLLWQVNCSDAQSRLLVDYLHDRGFIIQDMHKTAWSDFLYKDAPLPSACLIFGASNSLQMIRQIRSCGFDAPLIFLLPYGGNSDYTAILEAGADECVQMPISHFAFLARLQSLLRRSSEGYWLRDKQTEEPGENSYF